MRIFYELSILCDVYKLVELFWGMIRDFIQVIEDLNFDLKFKLLIWQLDDLEFWAHELVITMNIVLP